MRQVNILYNTIPEFIYGEDEESLEMVIGKLLKSKNQTFATAESCTGGEIAHHDNECSRQFRLL